MEVRSRHNPKVKHMKKLAESRKYREECGEFFCDGSKLLGEALKNGVEITGAMTCEDLREDIAADVIQVSRDIIEYISPMNTPQPVVFSCKIPPNKPPARDGGGVIVFENIQNPGNLGAVLRSADAFMMEKVILLGDCADLYSPKTIRAAMGAVFRQPVVSMNYAELKAWLAETGRPIFGAAISDSAGNINDIDITQAALAIGSEGSGLSEKLLGMCCQAIKIPMNPKCESLNAAVAASILMWEIYRRQR